MNISRMRKEAKALEEAVKVLRQLQLHHESQAKGFAGSVTTHYNAELAKKARDAGQSLIRLFF